MATESTPPTGRERRRKGPINKIRRFLYGVLLLAATPGAAPADELAYVGKFRTQAVATAPHFATMAVLQGLLVLFVNADGEPDANLDAVTAQLAPGNTDQAPQFRLNPARSDNRGVATAFELPVGDFGSYRLNLLAQRSATLSGWSLSGTLELARAGAERMVAAIPELRVQELHSRESRYLAFEATLRRKPPDSRQDLDFRWRI